MPKFGKLVLPLRERSQKMTKKVRSHAAIVQGMKNNKDKARERGKLPCVCTFIGLINEYRQVPTLCKSLQEVLGYFLEKGKLVLPIFLASGERH